MKAVVFNSPYYAEGEFPDARVTLQRGIPTQVTDEQATILLLNPDVSLVAPAPTKPEAAKAEARSAIVPSISDAKASATEAA